MQRSCSEDHRSSTSAPAASRHERRAPFPHAPAYSRRADLLPVVVVVLLLDPVDVDQRPSAKPPASPAAPACVVEGARRAEAFLHRSAGYAAGSAGFAVVGFFVEVRIAGVDGDVSHLALGTRRRPGEAPRGGGHCGRGARRRRTTANPFGTARPAQRARHSLYSTHTNPPKDTRNDRRTCR